MGIYFGTTRRVTRVSRLGKSKTGIILDNKMVASNSQHPKKFQLCDNVFPPTIPLGKQGHPCKLYGCLPLLITSLSGKCGHFGAHAAMSSSLFNVISYEF